jgi:ribonuclease D
LTNWEAEALTEGQQQYAAIDAWACLKIYYYLRSGAFKPAESPYVVEPEEEDDQQQSTAQS